MAQVEPMDIDAIESDFDNKENAFQYNNVLSRTPCTEKGYEELDVSELNMKLRYSVTPASSPMSKSLTGPCLDNRNCNSEDYLNNAVGADNGNLTRSLNSTLTKTECLSKPRVLPLQTLSTEPIIDSNRNSSMCRLLDQTDNNVIISVNNVNELDENLSLPSPCSSVSDTPEATTPTKEIPKSEGSPIMRGLKSVLSMFRPSQSPILPTDDKSTKPEILSPVELNKSEIGNVQVSTPVAENKQRDANSSKRSSPLKESLVFSDDLERELLWKDETTIIFKEERIPVHKLFFQNPITTLSTIPKPHDNTVEHMDISCDESIILDETNTKTETNDQFVKNELVVTGESDNEFLDCETTITKDESNNSDNKKLDVGEEVMLKGNITVDLTTNAEVSNEINAVCENILKDTVSVTTGGTNILTDKASTEATDISFKMDIKENSKLIEATIHLLNSESIDYTKMSPNVDTTNKFQENQELQLKDTNINVSVEHDTGLLNSCQPQPFVTLNIVNDDAPSNIMNCEKINESEQKICCDIGKINENCVDVLNNMDTVSNKDGSNEISHTIETNEIVEDIPITVHNVINSSDSNNSTTNIERVDVIGCEPNIDKPNIAEELSNLQYFELKSETSLLTGNEEINVAHNNDLPIKNDNLSSTVHNSDTPDNILNQDQSLIKDKPTESETTLKDMKTLIECTDSDSHADKTNNFERNDNHKVVNDMPVSQSTIGESDMSVDNIIFPPNEDLDNSTTLPTVPIELSNTTINIDLKSEFPEMNNTYEFNNNMKDIMEGKNETFSLQSSSKENVEFKIDNDKVISNIGPSINFVVKNVSDIVCEDHQLHIGDNTDISKSPSEVPLPDEDDIEQNILEIDDICSKNLNKQMIELYSNIEVKNDTVIDKIKIGNNNTEIADKEIFINKEPNDIQTCTTQSDHVCMMEEKTLDVKSEHIEQYIGNVDLQTSENNISPKETFSEDMSVLETITNVIEQGSSKMQISDNIVDKVVEDKVPSSTDQISSVAETTIVNTEKCNDTISKSENTNQLKMDDDNQKDLTFEKRVEEIDEEIITSANNSPYVSVTDLDKIVDKNNETLEDIDIPIATDTTFASSPPMSPKIVSKGYNFNFDEIDDPFATKTKIRMSPTPDSSNQSFTTVTDETIKIQEVSNKVNRRKSQPERKRPTQKKSMNSTFNDRLTTKESTSQKQKTPSEITSTDNVLNSTVIIPTDTVLHNTSVPHVKNNLSEDKSEHCVTTVSEYDSMCQKMDDISKSDTLMDDQVSSSITKEKIQSNDLETKNIEQILVISAEKSTSSSEQYFSLGTSSGESSSVMNRSKNVFNLPEIDDVNFNPFATKSKMRMSPPPAEKPRSSLNINDVSDSDFVKKQQLESKLINNEGSELTFNKKIGNDSLSDTSNTTLSSKNTNDIDVTIKEIPTEDEDTVEGPFLELDDSEVNQKVGDVDIEADMMNFEELPQHDRDENVENGEMFIDADAFEFLLNQNKSTTVLDSGKESLFLKFDPLFAKRVSSDGILAALSKVQKRQSTPKKITKLKQHEIIPVEKSTAGPSNIDNSGPIEEYNEDLLSNVTKPMMVVNPAISSVITQKKPVTPKLNRRSLTFTSPAMAVIDRLLSLSGNSSHLEHDTTVHQTGRNVSETDLAITQLRELLAEKEINVHTLRSESKELKDRLAALEVQVKGLETESAERLAKINELNERLSEKTKINKSMAMVVEEYERTIASLIAETEQDKKRNAEERMRLIKERDEQTAHLTSMEVSFSDLHSKYEKSKQIILSCKANEDIYKKSIKEFQDNFTKMQNNYELLKQHATSKLNHANQELEKLNRSHEAEVLKMNAMIKRKELHITSLEETLAQKTKANEELTAICDELINKVG